MAGYRDDREALLHRIGTLEEELTEALSDDRSTSATLAELRRDNGVLRRDLEVARAAHEEAEAALRRLSEEVERYDASRATRARHVTRASLAAGATVCAAGVAWYLDVPVYLIGLAALWWLVLYAVESFKSSTSEPEPEPRETRKTRKTRRKMRVRAEIEQRRQESRMQAKRRSGRRRSRRRR